MTGNDLNTLTLPELWPMIGAIIAGGLIGLEREWRGRAAGFRTHILVCLASALLMQAAMSQADWAFRALPDENIVTDPTRMAHGILTGIGFLCAGVIFRTGFSIHGLTTAASVWVTSSLGILFGAGMYALGALGTVVTALILVGLRLISVRLPARQVIDAEASWSREGDSPLAEVREALCELDPHPTATRMALADDGRIVSHTWKLKVAGDGDLQRLADRLAAIPSVTGYTLAPRDD
ncbi:MgtC/SapB family protein [Brevundimonas lutea]|uniref:MgtC/SapB family protein n=1 Tax=Brevundimonas lutea TaxID=2293980 RepID=UPI000F03FBF6|nr:MgtC/SapB family protein [Brevundimonas lutea]